MGKGDIKSRRGKLFRGTYGKKRPGKPKKHSLISAGHVQASTLSKQSAREPVRTKKPVQVAEIAAEEKVMEVIIPETIVETKHEEVVMEKVQPEPEKKVEPKVATEKEKPVKKEEKVSKKEEKIVKKVTKPAKKEAKPAKKEAKPVAKEGKEVKKEVKVKKASGKEVKKTTAKTSGGKSATTKKESVPKKK